MNDFVLPKPVAEIVINSEKSSYEESSNPFHVWRAYSICRSSGIGIPDWVLVYFDQSCDNLLPLIFDCTKDSKLKDFSNVIAEAMGFKKPGITGSGTTASEISKNVRNEMIVVDFVNFIYENNYPESQWGYAREKIAKRRGVSESTVRRALNKCNWLQSYMEDVYPFLPDVKKSQT